MSRREFKKPLYGSIYISEFKRSRDASVAYDALYKVHAEYDSPEVRDASYCATINFTMEYLPNNTRALVKLITEAGLNGQYVNLYEYEGQEYLRYSQFEDGRFGLYERWNLANINFRFKR